ncbi:MAG TPA: glycosyltransferase [Stellaceae bacterium]|nr:glycosyltransferase [Stellaceae bacterium]
MTVAVANFLSYRDRIVPRSEVHFLRRLYVAFDRLQPVWVGRRRDAGLPDLGAAPLFLGEPGMRGAITRTLFKHFGVLPSRPDLRALRPRLVHAHFGRGGALALPLAEALGVPLVVSFYGGDATKETHYRPRLIPAIYARRLAALEEKAAMFVCVSDFIRERLLDRGFPCDKLVVIRSGVDLGIEAGVAPELPPGYVLFAARFVEKKGATYLIEAVRRLQAEGRELPLVLIGEGPLADELKRQAGALKSVLFHGWVPNRELRRWMAGAMTVCVPSCAAETGDAEGLPTVVIEAMAAGTPVVGSRHAGIGEAVEHERTGLLVPPEDPEAITAALRRLCDEPGLRDTLAGNARRAAVEQFDARAQSRRLQQTLLEVIARSAGTS